MTAAKRLVTVGLVVLAILGGLDRRPFDSESLYCHAALRQSIAERRVTERVGRSPVRVDSHDARDLRWAKQNASDRFRALAPLPIEAAAHQSSAAKE